MAHHTYLSINCNYISLLFSAQVTSPLLFNLPFLYDEKQEKQNVIFKNELLDANMIRHVYNSVLQHKAFFYNLDVSFWHMNGNVYNSFIFTAIYEAFISTSLDYYNSLFTSHRTIFWHHLI